MSFVIIYQYISKSELNCYHSLSNIGPGFLSEPAVHQFLPKQEAMYLIYFSPVHCPEPKALIPGILGCTSWSGPFLKTMISWFTILHVKPFKNSFLLTYHPPSKIVWSQLSYDTIKPGSSARGFSCLFDIYPDRVNYLRLFLP